MKNWLLILLLVSVCVGTATACSVKNVRGQAQSNRQEESTSEAPSLSADDVPVAAATEVAKAPVEAKKFEASELENFCLKQLASFPGKYDPSLLKSVCADLHILDGCVSRNGQPIYHYNRNSDRPNAERILAFSVTHGDEIASGSVVRGWVNRLARIDPRNEWRVIPVLNPDGYDKKSRLNAAGVDINRNYPSADWDEKALALWEQKKSDPRRYPGPSAGSEPETLCSIDHINDFRPDLIISIHTPLAVLDFDGPKVAFPKFANLPWTSLGTYPGSLGRYMWHDRKVPVMTIELRSDIEHALDKFDQLQDISGQMAKILADQERQERNPSKQQ